MTQGAYSPNFYTGNGSTDTYAYTFFISAQANLRVYRTHLTTNVRTLLTLTTDYTVSGVGDVGGGEITLVAGNLSASYSLAIYNAETIEQDTSIRNQGDYLPEVIEDEFDHLVRIDQMQQNELDRSVKLPDDVDPDDFDPKFPSGIVGEASLVPVTNAAGDGWADVDDWPSGASIAAAAANATAAAASASAAALSAAASAVSAGTLSPYGINNLGLSASVATNALTIAITEADGTSTPASGTDSVTIYFRSATLTSGAMTGRNVAAATTLVVPSGATLGHNDGIQEYIHVYAIDNAGTVELAVSSSHHWDEGERHSTSAIGTGSDDAATLYSTAARTNIAIRRIGRIVVTQATAGTWATAIERLDVGFLPGERPIIKAQAANFTAKHGITYLVSSAAARNIQMPTPRAGWYCFIKDSTGEASTNAFTLVRAGSENIETVAANYVLRDQFGFWKVDSNGTNFFVQGPKGLASKFVRVKGTSGQTVPHNVTSWSTVTIDTETADPCSLGTLSSNKVTLGETGRWTVELYINSVEATSYLAVNTRLYNVTAAAVAIAFQDAALDTNVAVDVSHQVESFLVTNAAHEYRLEWKTNAAGTTALTDGEVNLIFRKVE
jgi:hypothetical protein